MREKKTRFGLQGGIMVGAGGGARPPAPSYYLVPTAHPGATFHPMPGPFPGPPLHPHFPLPQTPLPQPAQLSPPNRGSLALDPNQPPDWPKGALIRASVKFPAPQRVPGKNQFRDEILIRNADSGKIMGVKGRRVAVVESLAKTVISFQKVAAGVKERTLTLTANTEEDISHAKKLIEETIRRNVSPNREDGDGEMVGSPVVGALEVAEGMAPVGSGSLGALLEGGMLRLQCDDPEMLAAAQEALADYFQRSAPLRRSQVCS